MITNRELIKDKIISVDEALSKVKSNDQIVVSMAAADPQEFQNSLHTIAYRVKNVTVNNCLPMKDYPFYTDPQYKDSFKLAGWFYNPAMRKAHANGNISFIPNNLHFAGNKRFQHIHINIFVGLCSYPDKHGYVSLSLGNTYEKEAIEIADLVILEVNPNAPRTFGDLEVNINDVDFFIEVNYPIPEVPDVEPSEKDLVIGKYIADLINDGDCIQLGIGGIPNAVAKSLYSKKHLGVHTEMITNEMMKLAKAGVIDGKCKQMNEGKMVATFTMGTKELYDFLDDNPSVEFRAGSWTNDPYVIRQNDNQVSINTTLEVDLVGQCASESIGSRQFSGCGGQSDTAIGAVMSKHGRSIIALYSTTNVTNKVTGKKEEVSKIVAQLKPGAIVSLARQDVDYVVTEYGAVYLRGTTVAERVRLLIGISHPKFRDQLLHDAEKYGIIGALEE